MLAGSYFMKFNLLSQNSIYNFFKLECIGVYSFTFVFRTTTSFHFCYFTFKHETVSSIILN